MTFLATAGDTMAWGRMLAASLKKGEVIALLGQDAQAFLVALAVRGGGAVDLLGGVEDLEREDGKSIDDQAGRLGMQRSGFILVPRESE